MTPLRSLLLLLTCGLLVAPSAEAMTPCEFSAMQMYRACLADSNDDRFEQWARCTHIPDQAERIACREAANDERAEVVAEECPELLESRVDTCELLGETRHVDPLTDPANEFVDPDDIGDTVAPNPYFPLIVGRTDVLFAGEDGEELVVISVTDDTVEFHDVACRVVVAVEFEIEDEEGEEDDEEDEDELRWPSSRAMHEGIEYAPTEVTRDFYAQTVGGDVVYCGEDTAEFGDQGISEGNDGSFYSGNEDGAHAGWLMRAVPPLGVAERQEMAIGEAEDVVEYLAMSATPTGDEGGDNEDFSCAAAGGCLQTHESNPLEPGDTEFKYYVPGLGFVLAVALEDGEPTGEREELVCTGDSIDVLADEACGIENLDELWEELCEVAFDPFCELDDEEDEDDD